jgi:hypothetical protein
VVRDGSPSKYPDIAIEGSRFALSWFDERDGNEEIYLAQGFLQVDMFPEDVRACTGESGEPLDDVQRLTTNATSSLIPARIKPSRDGFALAWNAVTPGAAGAHDPETRSEVMFSLAR